MAMRTLSILLDFDRNDPREHYDLLRNFSLTNSNLKIIDAGTFMGLSAIRLADNKTNTVNTYDITDEHLFPQLKQREIKNINFHLKSIADETDEAILDSDVIFLDIDPHDGLQEKVFSDRLLSIGYKGIVMADDIWLNDGMINWWMKLPGVRMDLTSYGHFSGTGLWIPPCSKTIVKIQT